MVMIRDGKGRLMRRPMSDAEYKQRTDPEGYYHDQVIHLLGRIAGLLEVIESPLNITAPYPRPPREPQPPPKPQQPEINSKLLDVPL
jgi:hypothetical protein